VYRIFKTRAYLIFRRRWEATPFKAGSFSLPFQFSAWGHNARKGEGVCSFCPQ
jgi:hypothetical protein